MFIYTLSPIHTHTWDHDTRFATYFSFLFFWPHCVVHGILVPRPGIEPMPPAVEAQSPNQWTALEVPATYFSIRTFSHVNTYR